MTVKGCRWTRNLALLLGRGAIENGMLALLQEGLTMGLSLPVVWITNSDESTATVQ